MKLNAELNAIKRDEFPWMLEVTKWATNKALNDLGDAFANFFSRLRKHQKPGYPKFKKKGRCKESFYVAGLDLGFNGNKIRIPRLGWVRMAESIRIPGRPVSARFSRTADKWFVSIQIEVDPQWQYPHGCKSQAAVGVDIGIVDLAVRSNGNVTKAPRALRLYESRLKKLQRELSRRKKGGSSWQKTKVKIQRTHEKVRNIRSDVIHNLTAGLVRDFRWIGIEDLNVQGMVKNRRLAKSVADAALAEVRRQLEYKAVLAGGTVVIADRWFPSSKMCYACGHVVESMDISVRKWTCCSCGAQHDRDRNASLNLEAMAAGYAVKARGAGGADDGYFGVVKLPSWKRESSSYLPIKNRQRLKS